MSAVADPRRHYPNQPVCDDDSEHVLRAAIDELVTARSPMYHGDAGAELHVLASLAAEIAALLSDVVADARDQDYTWAEIAALLGRSKRTVKRGYAAHANTREAAARARLIAPPTVIGRGFQSPADHRHIPELLDKITGISDVMKERLPRSC